MESAETASNDSESSARSDVHPSVDTEWWHKYVDQQSIAPQPVTEVGPSAVDSSSELQQGYYAISDPSESEPKPSTKTEPVNVRPSGRSLEGTQVEYLRLEAKFSSLKAEKEWLEWRLDQEERDLKEEYYRLKEEAKAAQSQNEALKREMQNLIKAHTKLEATLGKENKKSDRTKLEGQIKLLKQQLEEESQNRKAAEISLNYEKQRLRETTEERKTHLESQLSQVRDRQSTLQVKLEETRREFEDQARQKLRALERDPSAPDKIHDFTEAELSAIRRTESRRGERTTKLLFAAFLVPLCLLVLGLALYAQFIAEKPSPGVVARVLHGVSPHHSGTVKSIAVSQSDSVTKGEVIALVQTTALKDELAVLVGHAENTRSALKSHQAQVKALSEERGILEKQLQEWRIITDGALLDEVALARLEANISVIEPEFRRIDEALSGLNEASDHLMGEFQRADSAVAAFELKHGVEADFLTDSTRAHLLELIEIQAPHSGVVISVDSQVGQTLSQQDTLLRVVEAPKSISVPVSRETFAELKVNDPVFIRSHTSKRPTFAVRILAKDMIISKTGDAQPTIRVNYPESSQFVPGEVVHAFFRNPDSSFFENIGFKLQELLNLEPVRR
ncbi:MAG: hypothetical protein AAF226_01930 [Verrucomicrobiota bacterium]